MSSKLKRFLSLLLAFMMVLSIVPVSAEGSDGAVVETATSEETFVAQIERTGEKYTSLDAAFKAAQDGDTIELLGDVDEVVQLSVSDTEVKTITLDLDGYTWDCGYGTRINAVNLLVKDGTIGSNRRAEGFDNKVDVFHFGGHSKLPSKMEVKNVTFYAELHVNNMAPSDEELGLLATSKSVGRAFNATEVVLQSKQYDVVTVQKAAYLTVNGGLFIGGINAEEGSFVTDNRKSETTDSGETVDITKAKLVTIMAPSEWNYIRTERGVTITFVDPTTVENRSYMQFTLGENSQNFTVQRYLGEDQWEYVEPVSGTSTIQWRFDEFGSETFRVDWDNNGTYDRLVVLVKGDIREVDTKEELKNAIATANDGTVIKLTADIDYGTDHLEITKSIILDLGGHTLTTRARNYGLALKNEGIIVTNGKLNHAGTVAAIKVWSADEISNLEIDVTGTSSSGNTINGIVLQKDASGVRNLKNVKIHSTSGQGVATGIETYECGNANTLVIGNMENVAIDAKVNGMLISAPCGTATNCDIKGGVSGIEIGIKSTYSAWLQLAGSKVHGGTQAVYAHDEFSSNPAVVNNGTLVMTADDATTFTSESSKLLTLTITRIEDDQWELPPALFPVATVNDVDYYTLADAVAAANAIEGGATVTLLKDVALGQKQTISGNVTIEGEYTITRAETYTGTLFTVNAGAALTLDGGLTIDGGNAWTYTKTPPEMDMANGAGTTVTDHITPAEGGVNATANMIENKGTLNVHSVTIQNSYSTNKVHIINAGANSKTTINGATIKNTAANASGAVAYINGNDAVLTIKGDTRITGNFGTANGGIIQNYGQGTTVNLEGGSIDSNHVGKSGTLYASYSSNANKINTFNMSGGIITNNIMEGYGPVYIHTNTVWNMTGGEISNNTSYLPSYVRSKNCVANITGGKIVDNVITGISYSNGYYVNRQDLYVNPSSAISGGIFSQDVTEYLAPDRGLAYDDGTGYYTVTTDIAEVNGVVYTSIAEAVEAANAGDTVKVLASHKPSVTTVIDKDITLDLNGKSVYGYATVNPIIRVLANVTVTGNGMIDSANYGDGYCFIVGSNEGSGNLTIENGTFKGTTTAISVTKGKLTILGGDFRVKPYEDSYDYLLNCIDANYQNGTAEIEVKGGVFTRFDPMNNAAEGANTNYVAEGYTSETKDEGATYAVRKLNYVAQVGETKYEDLKEAIEACTNGETVMLIADITYDADDVVNAIGGATGFGDYANPAIIDIGGERVDGVNYPSDVNAVINLNGHSITNNADAYLFLIMDNARITFTGTGSVVSNAQAPVVWSTGTDTVVTINGGEYSSVYPSLMWATHSGDLVIKSGEFKTTADDASCLIMRNEKDRQNSKYFISGKSTVTVTGGTFYGFNPEHTLDDSKTPAFEFNAVAERYEAVEIAEGIWTVREKILATLTFDFFGTTETYTYPGTGDGESRIDSLQDLMAEYMSHASVPQLGVPTNAVLTLNDDIALTESFVISTEGPYGKIPAYELTIDLGGKTLNSTALPAIRITGGNSVAIKNGRVTSDGYCFILGASDGSSAGNLTIESGSYTGETTVTSVTKGTLAITGGEFMATGDYGATYLLNCIDANYRNGSANIVVTGGTFHGFNPEDNTAEGANTSFVAENYKAFDNDDESWTVKLAVVTIENVEDLLAFGQAVTGNTLYKGVKVAANADVIVKLAADLDLTASGFAPIGNGAANAFTGTFDGQGHTISNMTLVCDYNRGVGFFRNLGNGAVIKNLTFDNADINNGAASASNHFYGVVAGFSNNVTLNNVDVKNSTLECKYAGAATIGCIEGASTIKNCDVENVAVKTTSIRTSVFGILGNSANGHSVYMENNSVKDVDVVAIVDGEVKAIRETLNYNEWAAGTKYTESTYVAQIGETKYSTLYDAVAAAENGATITLIGNVVRAETLVVNKDVTIDLNGKTVSAYKTLVSTPVMRILSNVTVQNGTVDGTAGESCYAFIVGNGETAGTLNIVGGTYKGDVSAISVTKGTANISGGYFEATEFEGAHEFTLNCIDSAYNNKTASYNITGGRFYKFNPENNAAEGADTNFLTAKYTAVQDGDCYKVMDYVRWVKAELLAGRDVTLDRDIVITDYSYVDALKLPSNGNGKYNERHGNGAIFHVIKPGVELDLKGHDITWDAHDDAYCNKRQVSLFMVTITGNAGETSNLSVKDSVGNANVNVNGMGTGMYVAGVGAQANINGGTWKNYPCECGASNIFLYPSHGGTLNISAGIFEQVDSEYLLGWKGSSEATDNNGVGTDYDETKVSVTGGTFVGFNPEETKFFDVANSGQETINGVAKGYKAVDNKDGTWTVQVAAVEYAFEQSTQLGLIEPWFMKFNLYVKRGESYLTDSELNALVDFGVYFVRASELGNPEEMPTTEMIIGSASTVHYSKNDTSFKAVIEQGTKGYMITASYVKGIYTYELDDSIYVLYYIEDAEGIHYDVVKERNLLELATKYQGDTRFTETERAVYTRMVGMYEAVTAYRATFSSIPVMPAHKAPKLTVGQFSNYQTGYTFKHSINIVVIEPWGIRLNGYVDGSVEFEEAGAVVFYDKNNIYASEPNVETLVSNPNAYVFSTENGDAITSTSGSYTKIETNYTKNVYTYQLDDNAYVVFFVKIDGVYHFGEVKTRNVLDNAQSQASNPDRPATERAVYQAMVDMHKDVVEHRAKFGY